MMIALNKRKLGLWWRDIYFTDLACLFVRMCMSQLVLDKSVLVGSKNTR